MCISPVFEYGINFNTKSESRAWHSHVIKSNFHCTSIPERKMKHLKLFRDFHHYTLGFFSKSCHIKIWQSWSNNTLDSFFLFFQQHAFSIYSMFPPLFLVACWVNPSSNQTAEFYYCVLSFIEMQSFLLDPLQRDSNPMYSSPFGGEEMYVSVGSWAKHKRLEPWNPYDGFSSQKSEFKVNINTCCHRGSLSLFSGMGANLTLIKKQIKNTNIFKVGASHSNHR